MSLSLAPHVTLTEAGDAMILLDERRGGYWQINRTGAEVLRHLLDGNSAESAAEAVRKRYPESASRAAADVENLISSLRKAKLVVS